MSVTSRFKVVLGTLIESEEGRELMGTLTDEQYDYIWDHKFIHFVEPMCNNKMILGVELFNQSDVGHTGMKSFSAEEESLYDMFEPLGDWVNHLRSSENLLEEEVGLLEKLNAFFGDGDTLIHTYVEYS